MRGERFVCSKCNNEFSRDRFRRHLLRKNPCWKQTALEFIIAEYDRVIEKFEKITDKFTKDDIFYFENRLEHMLKFHDNLDELEKPESKKYFMENVKPFYDKLKGGRDTLQPEQPENYL